MKSGDSFGVFFFLPKLYRGELGFNVLSLKNICCDGINIIRKGFFNIGYLPSVNNFGFFLFSPREQECWVPFVMPHGTGEYSAH
ncbi:hypothetical protein L2E82_22226 [Cichorium intybus]|uniref:Uncharacterized protein n=1 Tax=Cichorium intybus TaxID=13427 RepID=A0ACB9DXP4_CICIN|nr:hypothetical protein L2E82_22226 [Cichorium intybus]